MNLLIDKSLLGLPSDALRGNVTGASVVSVHSSRSAGIERTDVGWAARSK